MTGTLTADSQAGTGARTSTCLERKVMRLCEGKGTLSITFCREGVSVRLWVTASSSTL